jgi:pimeloyl-ACP methyl ester carboxylesterase/DNA-binding CsgD family transcriptional regulator
MTGEGTFAAAPRQRIGFLRSPDGARIAYACSGDGPAVVKTANWLSHLEYDWQSPVWRHWLDFLSSGRRLVRYDERGNGLSDHDLADLSFEHWVEDLEALIEHLGLERFSLLGLSQGGAVAVEYAARHPEKVGRLVLYGAYARGWARRGDELELRRARALLELVEAGWGADNPAYRQVFTTLFAPDADETQAHWFNELQRIATEPAIAARLIEAAGQIDVVASLARVQAPTLVLHARDDARVPHEEGRLIAAAIPGARFVLLEGRNHVLLETDPAWTRFKEEYAAFMGVTAADQAVPAAGPAPQYGELTPREARIVALLCEGLDNREIGGRLAMAEKTVRNHLTRIYSKYGVRNRAQLIVAGRRTRPG